MTFDTGAIGAIRIVAAVVVDACGRLLLVRKRGTAAFMLPGGKPEPGEAALDALDRELREELGCGLQPGSAVPMGRAAAPAANEPGRTVEAELFGVALAGEAVAQAEIDELRWIDPAAPGDLRLAQLARDAVLPRVVAELAATA